MKTSVKKNTAEIFEKQLALLAKKNQFGIIVLSSATDPYLHIEEEIQLTKKLLAIILHYKFPLHVITKSPLVLRDLELLKKINEAAILPDDLKLENKVFITFSFSTMQDNIAKIFEPGAPLPSERIAAMKQILHTEIPCGVSLMPLLPWISDTADELEKTFSLFSEMKIDYIFPATITLFGNGKSDSKTLVFDAIKRHFPHLEQKYSEYFSHSQQMPKYYQNAFYKKTKELSEKYGLKNSLYIA